MKIAVVGADGQLGADVVRVFAVNGDEVVSLSHSDIEVSRIDSVRQVLGALSPEVVVNTSAMHHVEHCEQDPSLAFAVNAQGAKNLAEVTQDSRALLVHISTDYVFDGAKGAPYLETDVPLPLNVYGNTKLSGEHFVRTLNPKHFVLRTSALYGKHPCRGKGGLNFVELMLKLARERGRVRVVNNEVVTPTSTADLAKQIVALTRSEAYGLYHATAEGSCSWFEYAKEIFQLTNTEIKLEVAGPTEFPAKVPRPLYSVLENHALKAEGLNLFRTWHDGLCDYLGTSSIRRVPALA
ncbi:MAG TPA: dTDP-4-dehydrorhamnose reductase [Candidatus Sulfotelmatobacter sp.]|nr:dTDP-4-dehydrorhamnose reductase [Candidatus Sulfotelmatobacter sp.]